MSAKSPAGLTVAVVSAALRGAEGRFGVRQTLANDVEVTSHATTSQHVAEQVYEASCILERAGFDTFAAGGGRLFVCARQRAVADGPWAPGQQAQSDRRAL